MAEWGKRVWMRHGALGYYECLGDDLTHMPGCGSFPEVARLAKSETVFYSFIIYRSKAHRNAVNKRVMAEMQKAVEVFKKVLGTTTTTSSKDGQ